MINFVGFQDTLTEFCLVDKSRVCMFSFSRTVSPNKEMIKSMKINGVCILILPVFDFSDRHHEYSVSMLEYPPAQATILPSLLIKAHVRKNHKT